MSGRRKTKIVWSRAVLLLWLLVGWGALMVMGLHGASDAQWRFAMLAGWIIPVTLVIIGGRR